MLDYTKRAQVTPLLYWVYHIPWYHAPSEVRLTTMLEF